MNLFAGPPALDLDFARTTRPGSRLAGWALAVGVTLIAVIAASDLPDPESEFAHAAPPPPPTLARESQAIAESDSVIPARPRPDFTVVGVVEGGDRLLAIIDQRGETAVLAAGQALAAGGRVESVTAGEVAIRLPKGGTVLRYRIGDTP
ncbi:MAG TPA: hypothetical protein PKH67_11875 [Rhodocyclaceae bacterium]|nr:hypothetical protein [Rhodocyclaceae bacterium]